MLRDVHACLCVYVSLCSELALLEFVVSRSCCPEELRQNLVTVDFDDVMCKSKHAHEQSCCDEDDQCTRPKARRRCKQRQRPFAPQQRTTMRLPVTNLFNEFCERIVEVRACTCHRAHPKLLACSAMVWRKRFRRARSRRLCKTVEAVRYACGLRSALTAHVQVLPCARRSQVATPCSLTSTLRRLAVWRRA